MIHSIEPFYFILFVIFKRAIGILLLLSLTYHIIQLVYSHMNVRGFYFLLGLILFSSISCQRSNSMEEPSICASDDFQVLNPLRALSSNSSSSPGIVDLSADALLISARFSEATEWKVVLKGLESGAWKVYEGKSNMVDLSFTGEVSGTVLFTEEIIEVSLFRACIDEPLTILRVENTGAPSLANAGSMVSVFNDASDLGGSSGDYALSMDAPSPQGGSYLQYSGVTLPQPGWFMGYFELALPTALPQSPDDVYLNFFLKGAENSQAQFVLVEKFGNLSKSRLYRANAGPNWVLHSIRLSEIGIVDPRNIQSLTVNMGPYLSKALSCRIDLDMVLFTVGKPLY